MTYAVKEMTSVKSEQGIREVWEEKDALFGIIRWHRLVETTRIGERLNITTTKVPKNVFLNGVKYIPAPTNI